LTIAFVVCGYGCDVGGQRIREYLQWVADLVVEYQGYGYEILIVSTGGITNPAKFLGISEAGMMRDYLVSLGLDIQQFHLEEKAATTEENLRNASSILAAYPEVGIIFVCCDSIRAKKVQFLAERIFPIKLKPSVEGFDFQRSWRERWRQRLWATPLTILGWYWPWMTNLLTALRRKKWGMTK